MYIKIAPGNRYALAVKFNNRTNQLKTGETFLTALGELPKR